MTKHEHDLADKRHEAAEDAAELKRREEEKAAATAKGLHNRPVTPGLSAEVKAQMEENRKRDEADVSNAANRQEVARAEKVIEAKKSVADTKKHKAAVKARPAHSYSEEMEVEIQLKVAEGLTRVQAIEVVSREREAAGRKVE